LLSLLLWSYAEFMADLCMCLCVEGVGGDAGSKFTQLIGKLTFKCQTWCRRWSSYRVQEVFRVFRSILERLKGEHNDLQPISERLGKMAVMS